MARKAIILKGVGKRDEAAKLSARLERMGYGDPTYKRDIYLVQ